MVSTPASRMISRISATGFFVIRVKKSISAAVQALIWSFGNASWIPRTMPTYFSNGQPT